MKCFNGIVEKDIRSKSLNAFIRWGEGKKRNLNFRHANIDMVHLYLFSAKTHNRTHTHIRTHNEKTIKSIGS